MANRHSGNEAGCDAIAPLLQRFAAAELGVEEEHRVWAHLAGCEACRARRAAEADPGALFMQLRHDTLPDGHWDGFMERLGDRLDREASPARPRWWNGWGEMLRYPRLAYVAAPLAMLLVVGATLFVLRPGVGNLPGRLTRSEAIRSPFDRPIPGPVRPDRRAAGGLLPDVTWSAADFDSSGPPALEEVVSPGARVYRFDVGGAADAPPIYLVVDESIDF